MSIILCYYNNLIHMVKYVVLTSVYFFIQLLVIISGHLNEIKCCILSQTGDPPECVIRKGSNLCKTLKRNSLV